MQQPFVHQNHYIAKPFCLKMIVCGHNNDGFLLIFQLKNNIFNNLSIVIINKRGRLI